MARRPLALLATVLAALLALLVTPFAAAEDLVVPDDRRDYWHDHRADSGTPDQHRPDWGRPDLRRTVYRHRSEKVRVRLDMARLARGDAGYWEVVVRYRTNEGRTGQATLFKPHEGQVVVGWTGDGNCFIDPHLDYADDYFVVEVSRSCLSLPRWIKFKSATRWWPTSDDVAYLDVSGSEGYRMSEWSARVRRD
ncbi:hypothetical protein [Nocardioides bizhenqiangii]|uniref:PLAT domain-containing protein n=1 Tax=Nocardioides bizhenqiangii TaxID=3095076 RepID=A0ABZ0ZPG0_9ACTN|nr:MULTISPECIES: hypothetical protein [unclassified Nocardioides]MDZ5621449.1 hypothetical protein [Nocardioides sp. HM23]WQQ25714.1 hypothetical protein SHK19_17315 [Nocardioides sp. HM61]